MNENSSTDRQGVTGLIVLGMHRSGTSCLAGSLQTRGVYLGEVHQQNPFNRKGNRENQQIMELNDAVLAYNQAAWDAPPDSSQPLRWTDELAAARDALIQTLQAEARVHQAPFWGFKDPRTLLTQAFWDEALLRPRLIGTFRHPLAVAASLRQRSHMPLAHALSLWLAYNQRLLALHRERPFALLCFDQPVDKYLADLAAVTRRYGMETTDERFFEAALRTQNATEQDETRLPPAVEATYQALYARYQQGGLAS